jgi:hypothetical protein
MLRLSPLRARLTTCAAALIRAGTDPLLNGCAYTAASVRRLVASYVWPGLTTSTLRPPLRQPTSAQEGCRR